MKTIIIGAGGFGREILDTIHQINILKPTYNLVGFIDNRIKKGTIVNDLIVLGNDDILDNYVGINLIIGVGAPHIREKIYNRYKDQFNFLTIIHPTAIVSKYAKIADCVIIQAFCIVAANVNLKKGVCINARTGIGHDSIVGDFSSIQSFCDITGANKIGKLCFLGTGVKVIPELILGDECYVCAGSIIFKSANKKSKIMGNPSKIIG